MITLKQLVNREYNNNKECTAFQYKLALGKNEQAQDTQQLFEFERAAQDDKVWMMRTRMNRTPTTDTQCYYFGYEMPRSGLPLELICATGLRYFKLQMQQEIQLRSNIEFTIGEVTEGM